MDQTLGQVNNPASATQLKAAMDDITREMEGRVNPISYTRPKVPINQLRTTPNPSMVAAITELRKDIDDVLDAIHQLAANVTGSMPRSNRDLSVEVLEPPLVERMKCEIGSARESVIEIRSVVAAISLGLNS